MQPTTFTTCSVDGCERRRAEMGLCATHAQRVRRTGSAGGPAIRAVARKPKRKCAAEGCEKDHYCGGYCVTHYGRMRRHGSLEKPPAPVGESHHSWCGDRVAYRSVHMRLNSQRGPASGFACVDCGEQAEQWSYDNADPDERRDESGAYSTDLTRYDPRRRKCHFAFDCRTSSTHTHNERFCFHTYTG